MKFETEYQLKKFREEQAELFDNTGKAFARNSHVEPMTRMLELINALELEIISQSTPDLGDAEGVLRDDWTAVVNGSISVPDDLDKLVNSFGMQMGFHTISGKGEAETICDMVRIAEEFFHARKVAAMHSYASSLKEEVERLRAGIEEVRVHLSEKRSQTPGLGAAINMLQVLNNL